MKSRLLKLMSIVFNLLLAFLLVLLVKSEFLNVENNKQTPDSQQNEVNITKGNIGENEDILALLSHEFGDLYAESSLQKNYKEEKIEVNKIIKKSGALSNFDIVSSVRGSLCVASGWLFAENFETDYIVFIDDHQQVLGAAVYGVSREGLSDAIGKKNADNGGWVGYLNIDSPQVNIHALSKLQEKDEYIELGTYKYEQKGMN